ncbi:gemin 3 [Musca autumnalis]|uniref:gemin 3 n=1 Tax=Musca autumnalis TaxID=221902 RepID=UPI003CEE1716
MEGKGLAHNLETAPRTDDVRLKDLAPFSKMLLSEQVRKGLHQAGFMYPTVIQATAIPVGKSGIDLLVQSKSGTGKTLIFSCIILESYTPEIKEPQSMIVAPTREIAVQIEDTLNSIGKYCPGFKAVCVIGGMDVSEDRKRVQGAKAIVGTPGRILHLIQNEVLNTSQIRLLVLDEADKMYSNAFRQDLQRIRNALPNREQTVACSATFEDNLDQELAKIMKNPLLVSTEERATLLVGIKQFVYEIPEQKTSILEMQLKLDAVRHIFGRLAFKQCLIFAGSQSRADSYRNYLEKDGWPCELISGAQNQKTRLEQFRKFREFKTRILIATDLMARGVDSEHVNLVINLELPTDSVTYLHRIGRAGRFGSHGVAISCVASSKDHNTFKKLISEIGTGMKVLKFPTKAESDKEQRDIWNFSQFTEDVKYFGLYQVDPPAAKAPLASQDNISLTPSLSENKENLSNNTSSMQQSSIDTNTFLVNSKDSAVNMPQLTESSQAPNKCQQNDAACALPASNTDNLNTPCDSHNGSTHQLITSNTIDDASSIAADSLRSSQQDISRYQSVLMQKSAIPTLVEFLVDRQSSQDTPTKRNQDLFDAYTEEVLNDNREVSESHRAEPTVDGPVLNSSKLAQLKSLLIDKPAAKTPINEDIDLYSDFANFKEDDSSISLSDEVDKQTFIMSVTTPSIQQDSLEELRNNSSDLYPATDQTTVTTDSHEMAPKEPRHFPSPAHNHMPAFIADVKSGPKTQMNKQQQQRQKLSINVTAHIEIPPYQSPPNSVSPLVNALEANHEEPSPSSTTDSSMANLSNQEDGGQQSGSETEHSGGNSSGFDEKTSTSGSSGIDTSEPESNRPQRLIPQYETSSEDEDEEDLTFELGNDADEEEDDSSEHYFGTDNDDDDEEENDDDEEEIEYAEDTDESNEDNSLAYNTNYTAGQIGDVLYSRPVTQASRSTSSNTITNTTQRSLNVAYQTAYSRWVDLYWNQMTIIQDYVKFFQFTRQQQEEE